MKRLKPVSMFEKKGSGDCKPSASVKLNVETVSSEGFSLIDSFRMLWQGMYIKSDFDGYGCYGFSISLILWNNKLGFVVFDGRCCYSITSSTAYTILISLGAIP